MIAKELRLGNYIMLNSSIQVVDEITFYPDHIGINAIVSHEYNVIGESRKVRKESMYSPIPLTEEWLVEKFGFEHATDKEYGGYLSPEVNGQQIRIRVNTIGIYFYTPNKHSRPLYIDYVHELQNLIKVLTKEELEVK